MGQGTIVSVHSYRGGTGKSNITANIAVCLAQKGYRAAVLDTDLQSPGIHVLFGLTRTEIALTLLDFLWGKCSIEETAYDVTSRVGIEGDGRLWLVPASMDVQAIARLIDEGYDITRLNAHFDALVAALELDYLLIDTHPGLSKETILSTAISDVLLLLVRPDQQDYQGTAVLLEVADKLELPFIYLMANKVLSNCSAEEISARLKEAFGHEVIGVMPLSEDVARLGSHRLFVRQNPDHEITHVIQSVADKLVEA